MIFEMEEMNRTALQQKGFHVFGMWIKIEGGGPPLTNVHIFDYPFEGEGTPVAAALSPREGERGATAGLLVQSELVLGNPHCADGVERHSAPHVVRGRLFVSRVV